MKLIRAAKKTPTIIFLNRIRFFPVLFRYGNKKKKNYNIVAENSLVLPPHRQQTTSQQPLLGLCNHYPVYHYNMTMSGVEYHSVDDGRLYTAALVRPPVLSFACMRI